MFGLKEWELGCTAALGGRIDPYMEGMMDRDHVRTAPAGRERLFGLGFGLQESLHWMSQILHHPLDFSQGQSLTQNLDKKRGEWIGKVDLWAYEGLVCPGIGLPEEEHGRMRRGAGAERWEGIKSLEKRL